MAAPASELEAETAHVRDLDLTGLRARWHSVFRRKAPDHLPRHLLYRMIACRLQAERLGDLDRDTAHFLDRARWKQTPGGRQLSPPSRSPARGAARFGALLHHRSGRIAAGAAAAIFLEACDLSRSGGAPAVAPAPLPIVRSPRPEQRNCHDDQKSRPCTARLSAVKEMRANPRPPEARRPRGLPPNHVGSQKSGVSACGIGTTT
jgi:Protein of unknown function (DUF2924)